MKQKYIFIGLFVFIVIISIFNFVISISFLINRRLSASSIFDNSKNSVVELKATQEDVGTSFGTAIIISDDADMITNAHIVTYKRLNQYYQFDKIYVRFVDEDDFREVRIIKYDLELDIAILKLNNVNRNIHSIEIGDDSKLRSGDDIYAVGNMSNYGLSITKGNISMTHVNVAYDDIIRNVIQCNLTISDGNSGGALLNHNGELVGITTFRLKDLSGNIVYCIAYCIPINTVMEYKIN